jgi:hypothetical protein
MPTEWRLRDTALRPGIRQRIENSLYIAACLLAKAASAGDASDRIALPARFRGARRDNLRLQVIVK